MGFPADLEIVDVSAGSDPLDFVESFAWVRAREIESPGDETVSHPGHTAESGLHQKSDTGFYRVEGDGPIFLYSLRKNLYKAIPCFGFPLRNC